MAEGNINVESKILCRYFVHGACNKGKSCRYSHDRSQRMDNVCKYYLHGTCTFADRCRYDHVKPKSSQLAVNVPSSSSKAGVLKSPSAQISSLQDTSMSTMVSLKKALKGEPDTPSTPRTPELWVQASEFVPGKPYKCSSIPSSYAHAASNGVDSTHSLVFETTDPKDSSQLLCPFSTNKECPYGDDCVYLHGNVCELCRLAVLKPDDQKQNDEHTKACTEAHEREMEHAFAVARSKDMQCGICMDTVLEKEPPTEQRFGILSDCTHCFCLACIRKWRASKQFDSKTIRSCPECRVQSDFVTPSQYWVETKEEKIKVIEGYKEALSSKPCKYFNEGRGDCPFNEKCFYLHLNPDGTKAEHRPRRRRHRRNADGDLEPEEPVVFWDFFQDRQSRLENLMMMLEDDLASLLMNINFFSDTDDDDDSDDDHFLF